MMIAILCLVPGLLLQGWLLSPVGVATNIATALAAALLAESVCLRLRRRPLIPDLFDGSSLITALILAAALPPGQWGPVAGATLLAVALGKHAYGGLGNNVFNPAMVGYAIVLVSFPGAVADWPQQTDALSGATALTVFKYRGALTIDGIWQGPNGFGLIGGSNAEWIGLAFLAGGSVLLMLRLAAWRPALGMLGSMAVLAVVGYDNGSSESLGSPLYHWFSGGTLLAICFVVTDPVTHPTSHAGQWLFGILVGTVTFLIRAFGNYPDGIAFAVLLANAVTPYLDRRLILAPGPEHD
jgi:electron transport complex protein RnfD